MLMILSAMILCYNIGMTNEIISPIRIYKTKPQRDCAFPGCINKSRNKGYCFAHARQISLGKELKPLLWRGKRAPRNKCKVDGCDNLSHSKGYCRAHYGRLQRHGDVYKREKSSGSKTYHILTNINTETRKATCAICGENAHVYLKRGTIVCCNNTIKKTIELKSRRKDFINNLKLSLGCAECGYKSNSSALQLHHLDPSIKEKTIGMAIGWNRISLIAEIKKCVVLCANCHAILHTDNLFKPYTPIGDIVPEEIWDSIF